MVRPICCTITGASPSAASSSSRNRAPGAQDAGDRQHLLLAARQLGALAPQPLLDVGKQLVDLLDRHAAGLHLGRQQEVLLHREAGEDAALLRAIGDAAPGDLARRQA
jgi:hypothetical protein